jgi:hypothetical protein
MQRLGHFSSHFEKKSQTKRHPHSYRGVGAKDILACARHSSSAARHHRPGRVLLLLPILAGRNGCAALPHLFPNRIVGVRGASHTSVNQRATPNRSMHESIAAVNRPHPQSTTAKICQFSFYALVSSSRHT